MEFNLSDKRKELRWQIDARKEKDAMALLLDVVDKQDKDFINKIIAQIHLMFIHQDNDVDFYDVKSTILGIAGKSFVKEGLDEVKK